MPQRLMRSLAADLSIVVGTRLPENTVLDTAGVAGYLKQSQLGAAIRIFLHAYIED